MMFNNVQFSTVHLLGTCQTYIHDNFVKLQGQLISTCLHFLEKRDYTKVCMDTFNINNSHNCPTSSCGRAPYTYAWMYTLTQGHRSPHIKNSPTVPNICTHTHILTSLNKMKSIPPLLNVHSAAQSSSGNQQQHLRAYVFNHLISGPRCFCGV